jgi:catechol 2,3-dioxygenase-like lactoylglutathione lyase family enzyme
MKLQRYSWCGMQVPAFKPALDFYTELLGMRLIKLDESRDLAIWVLPNGQGFEIFGPRHSNSRGWSWPVLSFDVESVPEARAELEARGVEFTTDILGAPGGRVWTFFRDPDGYLYEISERWEWRRAPGAVPEGADPPSERIAARVNGFPWAAIRPRNYDASVEFFGQALGLETYRLNPERDFAHFLLPSGEALELFGPKSPHAEVTGGLVLGFEVDDVSATRAAMEARAAQFITETRGLEPGGRARAYFKDPAGFVHEICQPWNWT